VSQDEPGQPPPPDDGEKTSLEPGMPTPGPPWHRASMRPEGAEPAAAAPPPGAGSPAEGAAPPSGATPGHGAPSGTAGAPGGGHLAAGVFLTVAGLSIFAGLLALLSAQRVDFPGNAIACGAAFAVLFVLAVGRRSGGPNPVRGTLGVVSAFFLAACFAFAVDLGGSGTFAEQSVRVKLASAAAVFALGQAVVGVAVPSAVAGGLALLGVEGTVLLSLTAAGSPSPADLVVAGLVTAIVLMLVALRLPRLRPHPGGLAWMLGAGAVFAALAALALAADANGMATAATGFLTLALALLAWRNRAVAPAIAAVPCLLVVEAYLAGQVTGDRGPAGEAAVVLASGVVLFVLVGIGGLAARQWSIADSARRILAEELLLVAAGVLALVALGQSNQPVLPFLRNGFSGVTQSTPPPIQLPSLEPVPGQPAPTFPGFPPTP